MGSAGQAVEYELPDLCIVPILFDSPIVTVSLRPTQLHQPTSRAFESHIKVNFDRVL